MVRGERIRGMMKLNVLILVTDIAGEEEELGERRGRGGGEEIPGRKERRYQGGRRGKKIPGRKEKEEEDIGCFERVKHSTGRS